MTLYTLLYTCTVTAPGADLLVAVDTGLVAPLGPGHVTRGLTHPYQPGLARHGGRPPGGLLEGVLRHLVIRGHDRHRPLGGLQGLL